VLAGNRFYFCTAEEDDKWTKRLRVWYVNLETGDVGVFSHIIDGCVRKMSMGSDGFLYLQVTNLLREKGPIMTSDGVTLDCYDRHLTMYHFIRIPIR
jgi:hypothetical protein